MQIVWACPRHLDRNVPACMHRARPGAAAGAGPARAWLWGDAACRRLRPSTLFAHSYKKLLPALEVGQGHQVLLRALGAAAGMEA